MMSSAQSMSDWVSGGIVFGVGQCRRDHAVVLGVYVGLGREDHAGGRAGGDLGLAVVGELPVFDHAGACRVCGVARLRRPR